MKSSQFPITTLLIDVDQSGKLYIPVNEPKRKSLPHSNGLSDSMQIDDLKDRVYIHNLDDELSDIESEEEKMIFLPDIEKKLSKIPKSVLLGENYPTSGNEMILYSVPSSLSVPKEHDKVRTAIIESRARAREKQMQDAATAETGEGVDHYGDRQDVHLNGVQNLGHVTADEVISIADDEDAMDLG